MIAAQAATYNVDALVASIDLAEYVGQYAALSPRGNRQVCNCPIHSDTNASFTLYPNDGGWYCFGCGKGGNIINFIKAIDEVDFRGALRKLEEYTRDNNVKLVFDAPRKQHITKLPTIRKNDAPRDHVSFWMVNIPKNREIPIHCGVDELKMVLGEIVAANEKNTEKLQDWAIVSELHGAWAGDHVLICPDTDFHKIKIDGKSVVDPNWGEADRVEWTAKLRKIPCCVAVLETYSGGVAPLILADARTYRGLKPSIWLDWPDWLVNSNKLDVDRINQRRFVHKVRWCYGDK
jgi:hypothetical protein